MKLWAGRFSKDADKKTNDFNSSIAIDSRLFAEDIDGSVAHAAMLGATGIISREDAETITAELQKIKDEIIRGELAIDPQAEDIHTFIEATLTERIGDAGKRLHTARSRNDQVALDIRLYLKKECDTVAALLGELIDALGEKTREYAETVCPGYTHLQRAQPITFGCHLSAYIEMLERDIGRIADAKKRMDSSPLGSGALAGTTYPIDRGMTAKSLGFASFTKNTLDGVADRDFCIELAAALSILMVHLSRLSEEIILWSSWEFRFIELDDAFSTGSSIMPQKKNPDIAELVRGKSGRVFGDLMGLLTVMKGLPLAYNKDMQEDKEPLFDTIDTVKGSLKVFADMIPAIGVKAERMRQAAAKGFSTATDVADYLVRKGIPFREAHEVVGRTVRYCIEREKELPALTVEEFRRFSPHIDADIYDHVTLEASVNARAATGGTAAAAVRREIDRARRELDQSP